MNFDNDVFKKIKGKKIYIDNKEVKITQKLCKELLKHNMEHSKYKSFSMYDIISNISSIIRYNGYWFFYGKTITKEKEI